MPTVLARISCILRHIEVSNMEYSFSFILSAACNQSYHIMTGCYWRGSQGMLLKWPHEKIIWNIKGIKTGVLTALFKKLITETHIIAVLFHSFTDLQHKIQTIVSVVWNHVFIIKLYYKSKIHHKYLMVLLWITETWMK